MTSTSTASTTPRAKGHGRRSELLTLPGGADVDSEDVTRILDAANQDETDLQRNITSFEQRKDDSSRLSVPPFPQIVAAEIQARYIGG